MNRQQLLVAAAQAHRAWVEGQSDAVPADPRDSDPHDGLASDYSEHHADRSAPAEVDDLLGQQLADLLADYRASSETPGDVKAAAADPAAERIQQQWQQAKERLLKRWPRLAGPMVSELADQAEAAVVAGDLGLLGELQASAGVVSALAVPLRSSGTELAAEAAAGVIAEAAEQGTTISSPAEPGGRRVEQHADAVARIIAAGYASGAARTALQLAGSEPAEVRAEVERHLAELGQSVNGLVGDNIGQLLSAAQFAGRLAVLEEHPADRYTAVEVNDRNRCGPCSEIANKSFPTLQAALADYPGGGAMKRCEGRGRCRGFIRPHW